ncbi:SH3 domain-containing C40 family peptidase [Exiguobacterium sp. s16]|uniref:SH3 domain-containing C40 family peptidase n=1 Tax=Exiguobacterium sp. s16 TaxID=2751237 RepID=UPI001BEB86AE|nr:SH3 domain-containing C40 family peptidase [Exiguobacterium sp. s16]
MYKRVFSLLVLFSFFLVASVSAEATVLLIKVDTPLLVSMEDSDSLTVLPKGTAVTVLDRSDTHALVSVGEQTGYVPNEVLAEPVTKTVIAETNLLDEAGNAVESLSYGATVSVYDLEDETTLLRVVGETARFVQRAALADTAPPLLGETRYVKSKTDLYASPRTGPVVGQLPLGQTITVFGQTNGYFRIQSGDRYRYVPARALSSRPVKTTERYISKDTSLYADATQSTRVGTVKRGQRISIYGQVGSRSRVFTGGQYRFVQTSHTSTTKPAPLKTGQRYITKNATLYSESFKQIGTLKRGALVNIYGTYGKYTRVFTGGQYRFVATSLTSTKKPPLYDATGKRYVKFDEVEVYQAASTSSKQVTEFNRGRLIETYGTSGHYTRVKIGTSYRFVATAYLSLNKPLPKPKVGTVFYTQLSGTPYFSNDIAYTRPAGQLARGAKLVGLRSIDDDFWQVRLASGKKVYVLNPYIAKTKPKAVAAKSVNVKAHYQTFKRTPFYANPYDTKPIGYLDSNRRVYPRSLHGDSYLIQDSWRPVYVKKQDIRMKSDPLLASRGNTQAERMIAAAAKHLGTPYTWGSQSPLNGGFDCSGLIHYATNQAGKVGGRTNVSGYWQSNHFKNRRTNISSGKRGDIIFFHGTYRNGPSHIGIMLDKETFIHAGGEMLQINSIHDPQWRPHFLGYKSL